MRAKPKGSPRKSRAARSPGPSQGQAGRRAGSHPSTRRSPAPRADVTPLDRNSGALKHVGGSQSDEWNDRVAAETVQAIPLLECETRDQKFDAALHGLIGIGPQDELEGMMAAQLIAGHAATMACYRCAVEADAGGERQRENLNQATRLSRAFTALLAALERRRDKTSFEARLRRAPQDDVRDPEERAKPASKGAKQPSGAPPLAPDLPSAPAKEAPVAARAPGAKSAKQPHAKTARPLAPTVMPPPGAEGPAVPVETAAHAKSAEQPHAKEIPLVLAPRVTQLRQGTRAESAEQLDLTQLSDEELMILVLAERVEMRARAKHGEKPDLHGFSDAELEAIIRKGLGRPAGKIGDEELSDEELEAIAEQGRRPPAAETGAAHIDMPARAAPAGRTETGAHAKSAEQPHAKPISVDELFAPRSPSPPAAEVGAAHLPSVAETGAHAKSAERPDAREIAPGVVLGREIPHPTKVGVTCYPIPAGGVPTGEFNVWTNPEFKE